MAVLLLLSLCVTTAIQVTLSQSTYEEEKFNSCERMEQTIHELATAVARLERKVDRNGVKGMTTA